MMESRQTPKLRMERTFDATPETVWAAWTDPNQYAKWLNPSGIDLVIHEYDVRPGGRIRFDMPQPDGNPNPQTGVFHVVEPFRRLVSGEPDRSFLVEVDLQPVAKGTRMVVTITGVPPEYHQMATEGWGVCLDQLGALIATRGTQILEREMVFTRLIDAPRELVYEAFTDPEQIAEWWGPAGFGRNTIHSMDVRPGGAWRYTMHGPDGTDWENVITYDRVEPPRFLSYQHGTPTEVEHFRGSATFEDVDGKTRLTFRMTFASADAMQAVIRDVGAMNGANQTIDKLEAHLKARAA